MPLHWVALGFMVFVPRAFAQIGVSDWFLSTFVQNFSPPSQQDAQSFATVSNPFLDSHTAALGSGTAMGAYEFSWTGDNALFRIETELVDPNVGNTRYVTAASGSIVFATTSDGRAILNGEYSYNLPGQGFEVICGLSVYQLGTASDVLRDSGQADTITSPSGTGIIDLSASAMLAAGHQYLINYSIRIDAFGNSGVLATTNGFLQLTLEPIPEPATVGLIGLTAILYRRRR